MAREEIDLGNMLYATYFLHATNLYKRETPWQAQPAVCEMRPIDFGVIIIVWSVGQEERRRPEKCGLTGPL